MDYELKEKLLGRMTKLAVVCIPSNRSFFTQSEVQDATTRLSELFGISEHYLNLNKDELADEIEDLIPEVTEEVKFFYLVTRDERG